MIRSSLLPAVAIMMAACNAGGAPGASPAAEPAPAAPATPAAPAAPGTDAPPHPAHSPTPVQPAAAATAPASAAGGLKWEAPAAFSARTPKSRMRAAEYVVAGQAGEAELTVYYFGPGQGGSVTANLDRWIGQFAQPDGSDSKAAAKIDERTVGTLKVTTLDLAGTFSGGMPPMMQKASPAKQADHRVLGAIADGPQGPVFFKLVGPGATVNAVQPAFDELVGTLKSAK